MANSKHITEDEIKYVVDVESSKAQQEIRKLEKTSSDLRAENKRRLDQLIKLEAAGKKNSQQYKDLKKRYNEVGSEIKKNTEQIAKLTNGINVNNLTMNQLKKQAKQLQKQLDDTSKALNPEAYRQIQMRLGEVNGRMLELRQTAKGLKEELLDDTTMGFLKGTLIVKFAEFIGSTAKNLIGSLVGSMRQVISTGIEMAESADGITKAFNDLDKPGLLDNLRAATKGTVNDVELMKAAVKAKDFRIPLEDLGKYLSFAQLKAQQTGESLDYMVDSIVTGLGRQSPQILDNLGLSASEIREQTKQTGDFMKAVASIVENQLADAGETYVSAADRAAQRTTALQNAQKALGDELLPLKDKFEDAYGNVQIHLINFVKYLIQHRNETLKIIKVIGILVSAYGAYIAQQKLAYLWGLREVAMQRIRNAQEAAYNTLLGLSVLRHAALNGTMTKTVALQKALNLLLKTSPWGLIAGAIGLVVSSLVLFNRGASEATKTQKMLNNIKKDAISKHAEEKVKIDLLVEAARNEKLSLDERKRAINALNEIIPGYNAQLDETTGKYRENKEALDSYLTSLVRKYEIEGAKEMLKELGREAAEANTQLVNAKKSLDDAKNAGQGYSYTTSWGAVGNTTQDLISNRQGAVAKAEAKVANVTARQNAIKNAYGIDLQKEAVDASSSNGNNNNGSSTSGGKKGGRVSPSDTTGKDEEAVFTNDRKKELAEQEAFYRDSLFLLQQSLAQKKITQEQYDRQVNSLELANSVKVLDIEKKYTLQAKELKIKDANDKQRIILSQQANEQKAQQSFEQKNLEEVRRFYDQMKQLREAGMTDEQIEKMNYELRLESLKGYYEASLEYARAHGEDEMAVTEAYEAARAKMVADHERKTQQERQQIRQQYGLSTADEEFRNELAKLNDLLAKEKISQEDYEKAVAQLTEEYSRRGMDIRRQYGLVSRQEEYDIELEQLKTALDQQKITQEEYEQSVKQMRISSWKESFDYYQQLFSSAFSALQDAELANVEAKYDAEIEAARKAGKDTSALENKKAQDQLKIQKKYADVNFAVKASQIIADTAVSIMKSYADLGPIAGSVAAALMGITGAAQLAAANSEREKIKKMTLNGSSSNTGAGARVATGLEDGGFLDVERRQDGKKFHAEFKPDKRGFVDRPTVIVGEGPRSKEWVASNSAVENPTVAPLLYDLDRAQKAGTIRTFDLKKWVVTKFPGLESGGSLSQQPGDGTRYPSRDGRTADVAYRDELARLVIILDRLERNGIPATVGLDQFDAQQKIRQQSRNIARKEAV